MADTGDTPIPTGQRHKNDSALFHLRRDPAEAVGPPCTIDPAFPRPARALDSVTVHPAHRTAQPVVACRPAASVPCRHVHWLAPTVHRNTARDGGTFPVGVSCTAAPGASRIWVPVSFAFTPGPIVYYPAGCPCRIEGAGRRPAAAIEAEAWRSSERGPRTQRTYVQYSYDPS